ncbi:MAG: hypothetical protein G01um101418_455 [Parcubacteria group bacterium Gr01-1014_18]|nr:MAG: hypothetical protein Greene041636_500 [Parcubacteria group bacterium Greene0416_36]TSC81042.1 MAG: hypothetical protein G01um101418_455 [Parcubacteria group bacterium Gr01-1014_18]TSC98964.1 MAG: hypothetical protein Greene101420_476 [Parcubacteria group bacterium Greene1014_20]TSD06744.1 MAG: hypothetical protein Greene07142_665 [Parcubacteria group bacterium Greene0714_2]
MKARHYLHILIMLIVGSIAALFLVWFWKKDTWEGPFWANRLIVSWNEADGGARFASLNSAGGTVFVDSITQTPLSSVYIADTGSIFYTRYSPERNIELVAYNRALGETILAHELSNPSFVASPVSGLVFYSQLVSIDEGETTQNRSDLVRLDIVSGEKEVLYSADSIARDLSVLALSSDGKKLFFDHVSAGGGLEGILNIFDLESQKVAQTWKSTFQNGTSARIYMAPGMNGYVASVRGEHTVALVWVDLSTGEEKLLWENTNDLPLIGNIFWDETGTGIIYSQFSSSSGQWEIQKIALSNNELSSLGEGEIIGMESDIILFRRTDARGEKLYFKKLSEPPAKGGSAFGGELEFFIWSHPGNMWVPRI